MPRVWWFHGKFVLCNGKRCKGERCTYPHSVEERDAWNAEKFGSKGSATFFIDSDVSLVATEAFRPIAELGYIEKEGLGGYMLLATVR